MTDAAWYALHSHPNKEELLWDQLLARNIEVFYPRIPVKPVNPRSRKIRPYFPGYMFVRADIEQVGINTFQWMPYASGLVVYGGEPASVPDLLIQRVRLRVEEITAAGGELLEGLKSGDAVIVQSGPLEGYEGIFDLSLAGKDRVRILLSLLGSKQMPVELDVSQIKKKKAR